MKVLEFIWGSDLLSKIRWTKKVRLKNVRSLDRGGHIEVVYLFGLILIDYLEKYLLIWIYLLRLIYLNKII